MDQLRLLGDENPDPSTLKKGTKSLAMKVPTALVFFGFFWCGSIGLLEATREKLLLH